VRQLVFGDGSVFHLAAGFAWRARELCVEGVFGGCMDRKNALLGRSKNLRRSAFVTLAAGPVTAMLLPVSNVAAQTLVWDPTQIGPTTGVPADGLGTWDTSSSDWYNATPPATGGQDVAWSNGDSAQFGNAYIVTNGLSGTAGTVNLSTTINATGIVFDPTNAGNYTINTGGNTLIIGSSGLVVNGGAPTLNLGSTTSTFSGGVTIGPVINTTPGLALSGTYSGALTVTGTGGWINTNTSSASFQVGTGPTATLASNTATVSATLNMSGLSNFTYSSTSGEFDVGVGDYASGTVTLATNNSINATAVRVGDTLSSGSLGGTVTWAGSFLHLGSGTNVIDTNTLNIGSSSSTQDKSSGTLDFSTNTGTLTIAGLNGSTSGPTMDIGVGGSSTGNGNAGVTGIVSLDGHLVNITAGATTIGQRLVSSTAGVTNTQTGTF
jgi:hypothetical protein